MPRSGKIKNLLNFSIFFQLFEFFKLCLFFYSLKRHDPYEGNLGRSSRCPMWRRDACNSTRFNVKKTNKIVKKYKRYLFRIIIKSEIENSDLVMGENDLDRTEAQYVDEAMKRFILDVIEKHGPIARRLCNKDPFALKYMEVRL